MERELERQRQNIELIASRRTSSRPAVMAAMGSVLTNKYAEGYPGKRYYGGCQYVDEVEELAIDSGPASCSARSMPTCSPTPAPRPTWRSTLPCWNLGDTVLGMDLSHGGPPDPRQPGEHVAARTTTLCPTACDEERPHRLRGPGQAGWPRCSPKMIVAGASRLSPGAWISRSWPTSPTSYGALLMVDMAHIAGLVAGGRAHEPGALGRRGHHHHPQDPAGPPGRPDPAPTTSISPSRSTRPSSPAPRAARWSTSSPPRRSASGRR